MNISYSNEVPPISQLLALYEDAGWYHYTRNQNALPEAFANSQDVIAAYCDDKLIGVVRSIGDKTTILYIQDIIVAKDHKRKGIGTQLVKSVLSIYPKIR